MAQGGFQRTVTLFSRGPDKIKGRPGEIRYEDWPTPEEMIERGTDISEAAIRYLVAVSHY